MITVKCKLKKMEIELDDNNKASYTVEFCGIETRSVAGETLVLGLQNNIEVVCNLPLQFALQKNLFDFLSAHSKEIFLVDMEKENEKYVLKKVSLIYG